MSLKILKIAFGYLSLVVNILIAVILIIAAYSDWVSPDGSLFLSYMGLLFPFFCFLSICILIYWGVLKQWKLFLVSFLSIVICWGPIKRYATYHSLTKEVPTENTIKVLTYNVMGFAYQNHTKEEPNQIIEYIAKSDADIVCLQEYFAGKSKNNLSEAKIYEALHMYPYRSSFFLNDNSQYKSGIAVFSKYPISKSRKIRYGSMGNGSSIHEITINKKKIILVNNHLESFKLTTEDRSNYSEFIRNPGTDSFDEIKGSFQQKLGPAFLARANQARIIREEIDKANGDYVLVCGDLNDTPISYANRTIQGELLDAFVESGKGLGITYNQNFFWFRIDRIFYSSNMKSFNCTVDKVDYSDHYPLWCYLQMN